MKYCRKCGKELFDEAVICPGCGCSVDVADNTHTTSYVKNKSLLYANLAGICFGIAALVIIMNMVKTPGYFQGQLFSILPIFRGGPLLYPFYCICNLIQPVGFIILAAAFFSKSNKNILFVLGFILSVLSYLVGIIMLSYTGAINNMSNVANFLCFVSGVASAVLWLVEKKKQIKQLWLVPSICSCVGLVFKIAVDGIYSMVAYPTVYVKSYLVIVSLIIGQVFMYLYKTHRI